MRSWCLAHLIDPKNVTSLNNDELYFKECRKTHRNGFIFIKVRRKSSKKLRICNLMPFFRKSSAQLWDILESRNWSIHAINQVEYLNLNS